MASSTRIAASFFLRASRVRVSVATPFKVPAAVPSRPALVGIASSGNVQRGWIRGLTTDGGNKIYAFDDVKKLVEDKKEGVVIIDTREPGELADTGRIPGAINIPVSSQPDAWFISEDDFEDRFGFERPAKETEVVMYCKAGVRSRAAAGLARQGGWEKVSEYQGSWLDWAGNGGMVERSRES